MTETVVFIDSLPRCIEHEFFMQEGHLRGLGESELMVRNVKPVI